MTEAKIDTVKVKTRFGGYVYLKAAEFEKAKAGKKALVSTVLRNGTPTGLGIGKQSVYHVDNLILNP